MKYPRAAFSGFVLTSAVIAVSSCSNPADCTARRDCPADFAARAGSSSNDAGAAGAMDVGGGGASASGAVGEAGVGGSADVVEACDPNADPATTACVIADEYGIFVMPDGDDAKGDGTQAKPFASVTKALSVSAASKQHRIYVCAAEYTEPDTLSIPDASAVFGGFSCNGGVWAYDAPVSALLSVASPVGATIDSAKRDVTLEDLRIDAQDAPQNDTGASSFGLVVNASKSVVLRRVEIHAGKGGSGMPGAAGKDLQPPQPPTAEQNGRDTECAASLVPPSAALGGVPTVSVCGSGGGKGGIGYGAFNHSGGDGSPKTNLVSPASSNGGPGLTSAAPAGMAGIAGGNGVDGIAGKPGAAASKVGVFGPGGYAGAAGGDGADGAPGQGGGGGGASLEYSGQGLVCTAAGGGAGGVGGCGGIAGTGGGGGGASVAMLSWTSQIALDTVVLITKAGGAGGDGGAGLLGNAGSEGGKGGSANASNGIVSSGGLGGKGGSGGPSGAGAGGTGGPSLCLVYSGAEPSGVSGSTLTPGAGGAAGLGGSSAVPGATSAPNGQVGLVHPDFVVEQ